MEYVAGFTHRCADGFLVLPGVTYDSDNPTSMKRKCIVCGTDYKGVSQYCSTECFEQDKEARQRAIAEVHKPKHTCAQCGKEFNGVGHTCSIECFNAWYKRDSFAKNLTPQDKKFLHDLRVGWE